MKGLTLAPALQLLGTLQWAGDHRRIASVGAPGWRLEGDLDTGDNTTVDATYHEGAGHRITVGTSTYEGGRYGYLGLKLIGTAQADGSVAVVDRFDPDRPRVTVAWPDGRSAGVTGIASLDDATLIRIASSVRPVDAAELQRLRAEGSDAMAEQPVIARVDVPSGTVTVVGKGSPIGVCLTLPGHAPVCADNAYGHADRVGAGLLIDGRPYAVAAVVDGAVSPGYGFVLVNASKAWTGAPVETATSGGWRMLLTAPPAEAGYRDIGVGAVTAGRVLSSSSIPWAEP
jgi:hypothetical protein